MENQDRNNIVQTFLKKNRDFLEEIKQKEFNEWISSYMQADTPEEEKILSYEIGSYGSTPSNDNSGIVKVNFRFMAETALENSIWDSSEPNTCYIEVEILDENNYQVNYISNEPKNLAEFKRQFEKYKKEHQEVIIVPAKENVDLSGKQVEEISSNITIIASIFIGLSIVFVIWKSLKMKK